MLMYGLTLADISEGMSVISLKVYNVKSQQCKAYICIIEVV